jgi:hypothetical protein
LILVSYQYFVRPIHKNLAHFAHRFFLTQAKFAHWSKNPGCATVEGILDYISRNQNQVANPIDRPVAGNTEVSLN